MKNSFLILLTAIVLLAALSLGTAAAEGGSSRLFCYVTSESSDRLDVLSDAEEFMTFRLDEDVTIQSATGVLWLDDAVLIAYTGSLNPNTQEQSVRVDKIEVLPVFNGRVEGDDAGTLSIRAIDDDGQDAELYLFDKDAVDILVGEEGIVRGDEVEVAYAGDASMLRPNQTQRLGYVHVTVYGQVEDAFE